MCFFLFYDNRSTLGKYPIRRDHRYQDEAYDKAFGRRTARARLVLFLLLLFWLPGLPVFQFWFHALDATGHTLTHRPAESSTGKLARMPFRCFTAGMAPIKRSLINAVTIITLPTLPLLSSTLGPVAQCYLTTQQHRKTV